jgi:hypothetical protein
VLDEGVHRELAIGTLGVKDGAGAETIEKVGAVKPVVAEMPSFLPGRRHAVVPRFVKTFDHPSGKRISSQLVLAL